ncbi:T9SS type A sorting domain-containing protein [Fulvivirga ulvae]|uniref:T9SS type A sorting domain-containing protein n=1 Tax=Fulvivirga ulvae TaxID=2904245 RepID=UPI001F4280A4|nr:T9SS type A sorting domain-containing protein [Fulvivirga ulvae]UII34277.1 T9SS type A sorting domain-containing protein [Fulvivirga ulvae]
MKFFEKNRTVKHGIRSANFSVVFCFSLIAGFAPALVLAQDYYIERFNTQPNGATSDSDDSPWTTIQGSSGSLAVDADFQDLTAFSVGTEAVWSTGQFTILGSTSISVDALEYSDSESSDYVRVYYRLDGGPETIFGNFSGNFASATATTTVSGSSLEIVVRFLNNNEYHTIDNVVVQAATSTPLYSVASGDWDDGSAWSGVGYGGASCGCVPNETARVNIGGGMIIDLGQDASVNDVTIDNTGTLRFTDDNIELNMMSDGIFTVNSGGVFDENGQSAADLDFEGGSGTSQLVINSGGTFDIDRVYMFGSNDLEISGDGNINLTTSLNFRSSGTVTNGLTGTMTIGDEIDFNANNATFTNNGTIFLTNNFTLTAGNTGNLFGNTGRIDIGGDIDLNNGNLTIDNSGIINQYGNFVNIDTGSDFNNLGGSTWAWYYVGAYDTDVNTIFSAGGLFEYEGFGDQLVIPVLYNNLTIDGSGSKALQANTNVSGVLYMNAGYISLGNFNLSLGNSASISGSSSSSYILTDGNGALVQNNIGAGGKAGSISFPVGLNTTSYTPVSITNAGTADNFSVRICSGIYEEGGCATGTAATAQVVDRTWFISESVAGGSNATLTFQWNSGNELSGFNRTDVNILHHNGSIWEAIGNTSASGADPYNVSVSGVNSFSPFGIEGGDGPLPVELTYFDARLANDKVKLAWETATELNNDFFTLEKSSDLNNFYEIEIIPGKGTTNVKSEYLTFDHSPLAGVSYYRLKQTDYDGTTSYSRLVKVDYEGKSERSLKIFPVPSDGRSITLSMMDLSGVESVPLHITDIQGRTVYQNILNTESPEIKLDFQRKLSRGVYLIKINMPEPVSRYFVVE